MMPADEDAPAEAGQAGLPLGEAQPSRSARQWSHLHANEVTWLMSQSRRKAAQLARNRLQLRLTSLSALNKKEHDRTEEHSMKYALNNVAQQCKIKCKHLDYLARQLETKWWLPLWWTSPKNGSRWKEEVLDHAMGLIDQNLEKTGSLENWLASHPKKQLKGLIVAKDTKGCRKYFALRKSSRSIWYLLRSWDASAKQLHRLPFAGSSILEESFLLEFRKSEGKDGSTNSPIWIIGTAALESASVRSKLRRIRRSLRRVRKVPQTGSMSHELMNTFLEADVGTLSSTAELPSKPTGSGTEGELSEASMPSDVTADLATGNHDLAGECNTAARVSDEREQITPAAPTDRKPSKAAAQSSLTVKEMSPKPSPHQHSTPMKNVVENSLKVQSNCNDRPRVSEELHEKQHMPISNSTASSSSSRIMVSVFEEGQHSQGSESTEPKASSNHSALSVDAILRKRLSPVKRSSQQIISRQPGQPSPQKLHLSQGAKSCQSNPTKDNRAEVDAQGRSDSKVIGSSSQQSGSVDGKKSEPGTALKKPTKSLEEILQKRLSQGKRSGCSADLTLMSELLPKDQVLHTKSTVKDSPSKTVEAVLQKYSAAHIARSQPAAGGSV